MKYGQAIFEAAAQIDTSPGSADTLRYQADLAEDLALSRGALDAVYKGPDGVAGTADDFDAILASANSFRGRPRQGGLSEHHRARRLRAAHAARRESLPVGGDVLRSGVLRAAP